MILEKFARLFRYAAAPQPVASVDLGAEPAQVKTCSIFKRIFSSGLFWASSGAAVTAALSSGPATLVAGAALATLKVGYTYKARLCYEASLLPTIFLNDTKPEKYPWYQEVCPGIYLGAIPLKNRNHHEMLKEEGITHILTLLESFEMKAKSLFSDPVLHTDWEKMRIDAKHISTPDFLPMEQEDIADGVEYLRATLEKNANNKAYIHCKAGRGRSATVVIAYMMKYGWKTAGLANPFESVQAAIDYVKAKRPVINMNRRQIQALEDYRSALLGHQ